MRSFHQTGGRVPNVWGDLIILDPGTFGMGSPGPAHPVHRGTAIIPAQQKCCCAMRAAGDESIHWNAMNYLNYENSRLIFRKDSDYICPSFIFLGKLWIWMAQDTWKSLWTKRYDEIGSRVVFVVLNFPRSRSGFFPRGRREISAMDATFVGSSWAKLVEVMEDVVLHVKPAFA